MHEDIHGSVARLKRNKQILASFKNSKCATDFIDKMLLMGLSTIRVASLGFHVITILRTKDDIDVKDWTREDVESVVREFQTWKWKSETRERFIFVLRRFVSFAKQGIIVEKKNDQDYSPEVSWLHPKKYRHKNDDSTLENRKGFTEAEIMRLLSAVPGITIDSDRDYLLILVGYEGGLRVGELILLKLKDIEIDSKNNLAYIIARSGKGAARKIPLILSFRKLVDYLARHPLKSDPEAYLFYSKWTRDKKLSYGGAVRIIHEACDRAGLPRKSLYKLRHSRITNLLLSKTPMPVVQKISGHKRLETVRTYASIIHDDVVDAVMGERGLAPQRRDRDEKMPVRRCANCNRVEDPTAVRCSDCGTFLDVAAAVKFDKARESHRYKNERKARKEIEELRQIIMQQQKMLQELVSRQAKD